MSAYIAPDDRMMVTGLDDGDWNVYNPITHPDTV